MTKQEAPLKLSKKDKDRVLMAARMLPGYANFLRWTTNFPKETISVHPNHNNIILLPPVLSGLFSFDVDGSEMLLGVQAFEMAWMGAIPFNCAYLSDRLYLSAASTPCMNTVLPTLAVGIFIDSQEKREFMANADTLFIVPVDVGQGRVINVGQKQTYGIPLKKMGVVEALHQEESDKVQKQDISRFF